MRDLAAVKQRDIERAEIERLTQEFLANGGKIQKLPGFVKSDGARFDWWKFSEMGPEFIQTELGG